jgi:hypothetical protein
VGATLQCAAGVIARESVARQAVYELEIWHASEARLRVVLGDRDFDTAREAGSRLVRSDALALARDALAMQRHV